MVCSLCGNFFRVNLLPELKLDLQQKQLSYFKHLLTTKFPIELNSNCTEINLTLKLCFNQIAPCTVTLTQKNFFQKN